MNENKPPDSVRMEQDSTRKETDDREMLLIFMALVGLALPALAIRSLFSDLNPLLLAGLGMAIYSVYVFWFLRANHLLPTDEQVSLQTAAANGREERSISEQGRS